MATYKSSYTGPQIDQAVGNALVKDTTTLSNDVNHIPASSVVKSAITHDLANIVATGTTNTTGAKIDAGKYFYLNGVLVQAIGSGIGTGAPFTLNTNYKVVTAGGLNELQAALSDVENQTVTSIYGVYKSVPYGDSQRTVLTSGQATRSKMAIINVIFNARGGLTGPYGVGIYHNNQPIAEWQSDKGVNNDIATITGIANVIPGDVISVEAWQTIDNSSDGLIVKFGYASTL